MVKVIAEIANAHQGNPDTAFALAEASVKAGADAVKFQIYFAEELLTASHARFTHFQKQAFTPDTWDQLLRKAKRLGVAVYTDVFGEQALQIAQRNEVDGYKIHSSDLGNTLLLQQMAGLDKTIFLAVGGSTFPEIAHAIQILTSARQSKREIVLLHGFQSYPTEVQDACLERIKRLHDVFGNQVSYGYMDHVSGDDSFAITLPLIALPYGIRYIEKHVTLNRSAKGVDYYSSLNPPEFEHFATELRRAESALGPAPEQFSESERRYRREVKKRWVAKRPLLSGQMLTADNLVMKRAQAKGDCPDFEKLAGKELLVARAADEVLNYSHVSHKVMGIVVARSRSSRLTGKALLDLGGRPALAHLFERLKIALDRKYVDRIAFCTTREDADDELVKLASNYPFKIYRGETENVLARMMLAVRDNPECDVALRITGDDLLVDPVYLHQTVNYHLEQNADYTDAKQLPSGMEVEVFNTDILGRLYTHGRDTKGTEYLTTYIADNRDQFRTASLDVPDQHRKSYRLTMDTPEDYKVIKDLVQAMRGLGKEFTYTVDDVIAYFDKNPERALVNSAIRQKAKPPEVTTRIDWTHWNHQDKDARDPRKDPLVSVYLVCHNYGTYVEQAIASVIGQTFQDFELIIIDDGSTDHSRDVISKYQGHEKVTVIFQERKGLNVTNNIALKASHGRYIMRLDADDYLDPNALLLLSNFLETNEGIGLVFPDYYQVDAQGHILSQTRRDNFNDQTVTLQDRPAHGACTLIRKSCLEHLGGYSEEFTCQDGYELWLRFIEKYKVGNINLPLFFYRQHDKNLTKDDQKILETRSRILSKQAASKAADLSAVGIIPVRGRVATPHSIAFETVGGKTLLDWAIDHALDSGVMEKVIVSSPDEEILTHVIKRYGERVFASLRPYRFARTNTHLEDTIAYCLEESFHKQKWPDILFQLNIEFPFRTGMYIEKALNLFKIFEIDSVIAVKSEDAYFYRHNGQGLTPVQTDRKLRLEMESLLKETGGLHAVRSTYFKENHSMVGGRVGHVVLDQKAALGVQSKLDLEVVRHLSEKA